MSLDACAGRYLTEIASKLIWLRQQRAQAEELKETCAKMLNDLKEYPQLEKNVENFIQELKASESEQFDAWSRDVLQSIDDATDSIALETSGKLMILEKEGRVLRVNYSDRLVRLLREVRQIQSLGEYLNFLSEQCCGTFESRIRRVDAKQTFSNLRIVSTRRDSELRIWVRSSKFGSDF